MELYQGPIPNVAGNAASYMQQYAQRWPNNPKPRIDPQLMEQAADSTFHRTGTYVPTTLALAQAQFESGFGTKSKGNNPYNNPWNVGVHDKKITFFPKTQREGTQAYYDLIAKDYLKKKTVAELLANFVNYRGDRYASNKGYEKEISDQMDVVRKRLTQAIVYKAVEHARKQMSRGLSPFK